MPLNPHEEVACHVLSPQPSDLNKRLDRFLGEFFAGHTRSQIQKWIDNRHVLVNGSPTKAGLKLRGQERIEVTLPELKETTVLPEEIPLHIVYEDADIAVVNKPAGLVVHIGAGIHRGTLVNALLHHFRELSQSGGADRPGIVHRLDKQTSGLLLIAKNNFSHTELSRQFESRTVHKRYLALVHGELKSDCGEIRAPIGRDRVNRVKMSIRGVRGREACTNYEVLQRLRGFTLLRVTIQTGRTHQIRVHLSSIRHPVVGDTLYGAPGRIALPGSQRTLPVLERNFLHAASLEFLHPRTQEPMHFTSELPQELAFFLAQVQD